MAKDCLIENMTVDAHIHGNVIEVENYEGTEKQFIGAEYREVLPDQVYCSDCGSELPVDGSSDINKVIKEHLEE